MCLTKGSTMSTGTKSWLTIKHSTASSSWPSHMLSPVTRDKSAWGAVASYSRLSVRHAAATRATLGPVRPMLGQLASFQSAQAEYETLTSQRAASRDPTRRWLEGAHPDMP